MIFFIEVIVFLLWICCFPCSAQQDVRGLKDYYQAYFPMGVAVNAQSLKGQEAQLLLREFNSITPENAMKMGLIHPQKNTYHWELVDSIVAFAQQHHMRIRGHTLLWHQQLPDWIFVDDQGNLVNKDTLLKRLKAHIYAVVGRYKGKVYAWDVVNEAIDDDPKNFLRPSKWIQIGGEEIIAKAFEYAHEADPDALLFYNDYNSEQPEKRERIYRLLKQLKDAGVPIDGVGLQAHWSIFEPSAEELVQAIKRYASLGLQLHFTELDMSVYPQENERKKYPGEGDTLTSEQEQKQMDQYARFFSIFRRYRSNITSVTFWNLSDRYSWLDFYPVKGRKNYPLLFDQQLKRKKSYWKVVNF